MKKLPYLIGFLLLTTISIGLYLKEAQKTKIIVKPTDYQAFLSSADSKNTLLKINQQIKFWQNRLEKESNSGIYRLKLAGLFSNRFQHNGNVQDILLSDSLLTAALAGAVFKKAPYYHALTRNAISQHNFQQALVYIQQALDTKETPEASALLYFDVLMEVGEVEKATAILEKITDKEHFDYKIRLAKIQDHKGNLPAAIQTMESVVEWCETSKNNDLWLWAKSNLGDMYGHAGLIEQSYKTYLEVLNEAPDYLYALKGIAWVAFSNDKNTDAASEIVEYLMLQKPTPDLYLLKAEIAEFQGKHALAITYSKEFLQEASKPAYGKMYHSHIADVKLNYFGADEVAKTLALEEISNRPTPHSYLLLARYHFEKNEMEKAIKIIENHVEGKTFEPDVLYHIGMIYKVNGQCEKAKKYLDEAADAQFELGPAANENVKTMMIVL